MGKINKTKRSPLKDKPLRYPGQSLLQQRNDLFDSKILAPLVAAMMFTTLAGIEWLRYFRPSKPSPLAYTVLAFLAIAYFGYQSWKTLPQLKKMNQGIDGEKAVGQYLERLREDGYQVFHDVIGDGFNLDHVVIGPAGVFTVETKTWSKPDRGSPKIVFDGESIKSGYMKPNRDPLIQARAQSAWLRQLLEESTGKHYNVRPVIVFPGWFIESTKGANNKLWVLEPKALPKFLSNVPDLMPVEDIKLASYHLSRFVRSREKNNGGALL
ncbi:nuclease-like protein [Thiogranum longum]|uniref:Nuclease-like protein n=2 Tax=Thiogranum longum TaxID=1537524 RepID=A0A4R1HBF3_9GAMM|nr:nuclease-like protein [Thiogranum longum]